MPIGGSFNHVTIYSPSGVPFNVAADHAQRFQNLINGLEAAGYNLNSQESGGYNPRFIHGTNIPSQHAFGHAIDVNSGNNQQGTAGEIDPDLARKLAADNGLQWGGDWSGKTRDPMHFQVAKGASPMPLAQQPSGAASNSASDLPSITTADTTPIPFSSPMGLGAGNAPPPTVSPASAPPRGVPGPVNAPSNSNGGSDWVMGPLGLMPSYNGETALQPYAKGGDVASSLPPLPSLGKVTGPLKSHVPGRTDHLPITVPADSFVVPADVVSGLGEGNSEAGLHAVASLFPGSAQHAHLSAGGGVPIMAAGGEYVIPPDAVAKVGKGDLKKGHAILDKWVVAQRKKTIDTLKKLPGPSK